MDETLSPQTEGVETTKEGNTTDGAEGLEVKEGAARPTYNFTCGNKKMFVAFVCVTSRLARAIVDARRRYEDAIALLSNVKSPEEMDRKVKEIDELYEALKCAQTAAYIHMDLVQQMHPSCSPLCRADDDHPLWSYLKEAKKKQ